MKTSLDQLIPEEVLDVFLDNVDETRHKMEVDARKKMLKHTRTEMTSMHYLDDRFITIIASIFVWFNAELGYATSSVRFFYELPSIDQALDHINQIKIEHEQVRLPKRLRSRNAAAKEDRHRHKPSKNAEGA